MKKVSYSIAPPLELTLHLSQFPLKRGPVPNYIQSFCAKYAHYSFLNNYPSNVALSNISAFFVVLYYPESEKNASQAQIT